MKGVLTHSIYRKLLSDIAHVYERARGHSICALNEIAVRAHWQIGKNIVEVEQRHGIRAEYGARLLERLSDDLTQKYGKGFSISNLQYMRKFYQQYQIQHARVELSWTHYRTLLSIEDKTKRALLEKKVIKEKLTSRALEAIVKKEHTNAAGKRTYHRVPKRIRLPMQRGVLFTYRVFHSNYIYSTRGHVLIDCGFNIFREVPVKTGARFRHGDVVVVARATKGYRLKKSTVKKSALYTYVAYVERIVDGDTILVNVDCGFGCWTRQRIRLRSINAPEISTDAGRAAKRFVDKKLTTRHFIVIKTYRSDKYDRYLADVFYLSGAHDEYSVARDGRFLNQELVDSMHAVVVKA